MSNTQHQHRYRWTGSPVIENGIYYQAFCRCGKEVREVWVKSHYEDEQGAVLPDSVEELIE